MTETSSLRLADRSAIVVGAGQTPGETLGNGRAVALTFAREGASVLVVDRDADSAADTVRLIEQAGGTASALAVDATREADLAAMTETCVSRYGRIDVLHNNVGLSEGDRPITELPESTWSSLLDVNLKSVFLACKHVLPVMREQGSGVIINTSSTSSVCTRPTITYRTAKAGINAMTQNMAVENAPYGVRVNAILPGLMDTPMAIERRARERGVERDVVRAERNAQVPLQARMGSAWDVANAALWLASDEAGYVTGVLLPVDGGLSARVG